MAYTGVWLTASQLQQQERGQVIVPPKFQLPSDWTFVPRDGRKRKAEIPEARENPSTCPPRADVIDIMFL